MKRLFVAVKVRPDSAFLERFREMKEDLRHEKIKWVEENNIHITLKFLGETVEERIPGIITTLKHTAESTAPFSFRLEKTGIFGSRYAPRVIWTGIQPYERLAELMKRVHHELQSNGFEPDRQNLVPHLTLGRIKFLEDKNLFQSVLEDYRNISSLPMTASGFHLYESVLTKSGPVYTSLERFDFT